MLPNAPHTENRDNNTLDALRLVQSMQVPLKTSLESMSQLNSIPSVEASSVRTFNKVGARVVNVGSSLDQLSQIQGGFAESIKGVHSLSSTFSFLALGFATSEFLRISHAYITAKRLGEQTPIVSLSKKARLASSGVLLALAVIALSAPVTAVPIALISASLGLVTSIAALTNYYLNQKKLSNKLEQINSEVETKLNDFAQLQADAGIKETLLKAAIEQQNPEEIEAVSKDIYELNTRIQSLRSNLQQLTDEQAIINQVQMQRAKDRVTEKAIGVFISSAATVGLVVSLFFPPVGLGIIASSAAIGALYLTAKLLTPLFKRAALWIQKQLTPQPKGVSSTDVDKEGNAVDLKPQSTVCMLQQLTSSVPANTNLAERSEKTKLLERDSNSNLQNEGNVAPQNDEDSASSQFRL